MIGQELNKQRMKKLAKHWNAICIKNQTYATFICLRSLFFIVCLRFCVWAIIYWSKSIPVLSARNSLYRIIYVISDKKSMAVRWAFRHFKTFSCRTFSRSLWCQCAINGDIKLCADTVLLAAFKVQGQLQKTYFNADFLSVCTKEDMRWSHTRNH